MKHRIKKILQSFLGLDLYLFLFSLVKIATLRWDSLEGEFIHFLSLVPEEGICLDIGANVGIMTVLLAKKARSGTVYAFEPMSVNFRALQRVVRLFRLRNVVACPWALGNQEAEIEMLMPIVDSVHLQGLSHVVHESIPEQREGEKVRVSCKRLDDVEALFQPQAKVTAIKIDVQDFEYFVFDGARKLLHTYRPIIYCELGNNDNRRKTLALFKELNYVAKVWASGGLTNFDPQLHSNYWNFFLIPLG